MRWIPVCAVLLGSLLPIVASAQLFKGKTSVMVLKEAPARADDAEVEVFATEPKDRKFEDLCMITVTGGQTIFSSKSGSGLMKKVLADARKCGADAVIVRSSEDRTWKPLRGGIDQGAKSQAVAIRFTDEKH